MPTDSGTYPSESSDIDDDSDEDDTEGSEDDMDALMNMASAQSSQVSVFVPKPGQSLGLSLAPHPEGTYVHSTTSTDKEKMATVGKVATAIVPSGNRGAGHKLSGLGPGDVAKAIVATKPPYTIYFEDPKMKAPKKKKQVSVTSTEVSSSELSESVTESADTSSRNVTPAKSKPSKPAPKPKSKPAPTKQKDKGGGNNDSDAEVVELKKQLATSEKLVKTKQSMIENSVKSKTAAAKEMQAKWDADKVAWGKKEKELLKKLKDGDGASKQVAEVQELMDMLQMEVKNNDRVKEALRSKAETELKETKAEITALRETDLQSAQKREAELQDQLTEKDAEYSALMKRSEFTIIEETDKVAERWHHERVGWENQQASLEGAIHSLQQKMIRRDEQMEEAQQQLFAWEEDFGRSAERHRLDVMGFETEIELLHQKIASLEAQNQQTIALWWNARERPVGGGVVHGSTVLTPGWKSAIDESFDITNV